MKRISIIITMMYALSMMMGCSGNDDEERPAPPTPSSKNETFTVNGVSFTMVAVEGGTFKMGAQKTDASGDNYDAEATDNETPVHSVTLDNYYIGETEVTQALWLAVMGSNPSNFSGTHLPVECVSWNNCQEFITKLNVATGKTFRLPTEAEWEYAARGGSKSKGYKYSGSNTIDDVAWYYSNSDDKTHVVKTKAANELGLYDMSGNVMEWCSDWFAYYSNNAQTNPQGPSTGFNRVCRGGCWGYIWSICGNSCRVGLSVDSKIPILGLRLAL